MPYDPTKRSYSYIDGELPVRPRQLGTTRTAQVLPRKNYDPVELARQARHQAREEAKQRSRTTEHTHRAIQGEEEYDDADIDGNGDVWPPLQHTSAIRHNLPPEGVYQTGNKRVHVEYVDIPPRASAKSRLPPAPQQQTRYTDEIDELETERPPKRRRRGIHLHWLAILGLGMVIMLALVVGGNAVSSWWTIHQDDSTYGRPRTFQIDQVVGHNDSAENPSHFEAINLNRHIIVIELPGGDSSKARIYNITTLFGNGQELTPVTISFKDVNNDGLLDMEIHIKEQTIVFINENGQFRPLKPTEHVHL
jgi:hypothetical protein